MNTSVRATESQRAEAAAWIARLHGPARDPALEAGLRSWLSEDPRHAQAFERMTRAWDDATTIAARERFPRIRRAAPRLAPPLKKWAIAATVLLVGGLAAFGAHLFVGRNTYSTDIGEQRTVRLDDGSRVSLNSDTKLVIHYGARLRHVQLDRGEAFFEVAQVPTRPFVVAAGGRDITALGTSFAVRYDGLNTAVTLVDGKVQVEEKVEGRAGEATDSHVLQSHAQTAAVVLEPGERLTFAANTPKPVLDTPKVEAVTAWRRGEVVLEKTNLADAVAEMNRYDRNRLVVDDASVAGLQVSGIYRSGDNAGFARAVARMYGLDVAEGESGIHFRERKGE